MQRLKLLITYSTIVMPSKLTSFMGSPVGLIACARSVWCVIDPLTHIIRTTYKFYGHSTVASCSKTERFIRRF